MNEHLFPKELLSVSIENHIQKYSKVGYWIYLLLLLIISAAFISLFLVKIDLVVSASGMIRPIIEKSVIRSQMEGKIIASYLREDKKVKRGELLLEFNPEKISIQQKLISFKIKLQAGVIEDLNYLLKNFPDPNYQSLNNSYLQIEYDLFLRKREKINHQMEAITREIGRNKELFEHGMVAEKKMSELYFELTQCQNELKIADEDMLLRLQKLKHDCSLKMNSLKSEQMQLNEKMKGLKLHSPVSGTIQNIRVHSNSYVIQGQEVANISPDTTLVAELFVKPNQIPLLQIGDTAQLKILALNSNRWGTLKAMISSISPDYHIINEQPVFRVLCKLESSSLRLQNDKTIVVNKGMMVNAFFRVTKRSLFQILYDKVDNWLIPDSRKYPVHV